MMVDFPVFLSVVVAVRNQSDQITNILMDISHVVETLVPDYELIIVDNASTDDSVETLKMLTGEDGLPNLQVFALTKEVDTDTASWVGLENSLGDFVVVFDPTVDDISFVRVMLDRAVCGADVVFASNGQRQVQGLIYRACSSSFNAIYKWFNGFDLAKEAPQYRVLSRRVVNFILQHPTPALTYRHLPASGGFTRSNLAYSAKPKAVHKKHLLDSIDRGMRLLVSTTRGPMRLVTSLSLFGAISNLIYSGYVITVAIVKTDVEPGWITLSLQQSGMFFLISLVLLVLAEYILHMASLSNEGPLYHVAQEFTSALMTHTKKLNIEEADTLEKFSPGPQLERYGDGLSGVS